jgi:hypothetical protein
MKLRLTIPCHPDETSISLVSRLAARNGTNARRLCKDFGMRFQDVVDGDAETLKACADLAGIGCGPLLANAFQKSQDRSWLHRGEVLHRKFLRRRRVALCPRCALADIEANPGLRPNIAVYGRWPWLMTAINTCHIHRIALVTVPEVSPRQNSHDFTALVAGSISDLAKMSAAANVQEPGSFETYVHNRFAGKSSSPLLDPMPLAAAMTLCEIAGAVALFGPKVDLKKLSDADRHTARGRGCDAIAGGAGSIPIFLDQLKETIGPRMRTDGPAVVYGRLHYLLQMTTGLPEFDAMRDIVRGHLADNFVFEPGQNLFGKPVAQPRLHSLHTLAQEVDVHPKRLRKVLKAVGLITDQQMAMSDHNIRIPAAPALEIARQLVGTLSLVQATKYLNAPRSQIGVLIAAGFVEPHLRIKDAGGTDRYAIADLDALLARLTKNPRPADAPRVQLVSILQAAKLACCSAAAVVGLILEGKLPTGSSKTMSGYMGVLVDPNAVVTALRGPEPEGVNLRTAAREIGTSDWVLDLLIAHGHIASFKGRNPINRCPQTLITPDDIAKFNKTYVSLWNFSKERGVHIATMKIMLDEAGIKPAFNWTLIGARFYERSVVQDS